MRSKFLLTILLSVFATLHSIVGKADPVARLLSADGMGNASVGICIMDISSGRVVTSCNEHRALVPASVTKIVTAASVLNLYPDTMQWHTQVGYSGDIGADGTLHGDIIIRGCIDPTLSGQRSERSKAAFTDALVAAVRRAGITAVEGRIVADASICDVSVSAQWLSEDLGWYYGAGCYGINYQGNRYDLFLQTGNVGSTPVIAASSLPMPMLVYRNHLVAGSKDSSFVAVNPYAPDCVLSGIVPANRTRFRLPCSMPDPPLVLAYDLNRTLSLAGIRVTDEPVTDRMLYESGEKRPSVSAWLCSYPSDTLSVMLQTMLWHSDNLYAEALLRYIALSAAPVARTSTALVVEHDLWKNAGLDVQEMNLVDGCGLARKNTLTPHFIASLLAYMYNSEIGQRFLSFFPRAGHDGTVRSFMASNPLPGVLRLKSGSMGGVLCYAGYYVVGGRAYAVALMSNNHTCRTAVVRTRFEQFLRNVFLSK